MDFPDDVKAVSVVLCFTIHPAISSFCFEFFFIDQAVFKQLIQAY